MNMDSCKEFYQHFINDVHENVINDFPNESVMGITSDKKFIKFENIHADPQNFFKVDPQEYYKHDVVMLIHSHTVVNGVGLRMPDGTWMDPRTPSIEDMKLRQDLDIMFAIVSTDGKECSYPIYFPDYEAPLLGVEYVNNAYDCLNLILRFYYQEYGMKFEDYPRAAGHWLPYCEHPEVDVYKRMYEDYDFVTIEGEPEYGDVIMFNIKNSVSHAGVYIGDDKFIHHVYGRLSCTESLARWRSRVWKIARHKDHL